MKKFKKRNPIKRVRKNETKNRRIVVKNSDNSIVSKLGNKDTLNSINIEFGDSIGVIKETDSDLIVKNESNTVGYSSKLKDSTRNP
tara:strand:- start:165 stop:422 length:258 start_codon:yes stop_codon:yes gene_type:complete